VESFLLHDLVLCWKFGAKTHNSTPESHSGNGSGLLVLPRCQNSGDRDNEGMALSMSLDRKNTANNQVRRIEVDHLQVSKYLHAVDLGNFSKRLQRIL